MKSIIDIYDFNQAILLRYSGHQLHSISKLGPVTIYRFYFRKDSLALLAALPERSLGVEPKGFYEAICDLVMEKLKYDKKGLDKNI